MAPGITLTAAGRSLRRIAEQTPGGAARTRIEQLASIAEAAPAGERELRVAAVTDALFADAADPVERFRAFRATLRKLAREQGVELDCEVDGHKHAPAAARRCWFAGDDDGARRFERLSGAATAELPGSPEVDARARRAVRVCVDGPDTDLADDLSSRLRELLHVDRELQVEVSRTQPFAGESAAQVLASQVRQADVVVCLLTTAHLGMRTRDDFAHALVVPVELEHLAPATDLRGFEAPFALRGCAYADSRRKPQFVAGLREHIAARIERASAPVAWHRLLPDDDGPIVEARAQRTSLERRPTEAGARLDATVDVQEYLRDWADSAGDRPYLVIFGEYGMGKTTACQVLTRRLLERRARGDGDARLPIYLDLRRLGDVKRREPTLEAILDDLLRRVWQAGAVDPAATAAEVIEQVQRRGAIVIFDGLDEVLVHLSETQGQALLRELWKILPPSVLADSDGRARPGRVVMTCRTHFFRTLREQHTFFRGEEREIVGEGSYAALHLLPFEPAQVRAYLERREGDGAAVDRALELIRSIHNLTELVQRPFTLRLVADQIGALERRIATGARVDTASLYEELVATWLDRDQGKHQLEPRHKLRLMGELAAELWREGRRSLPVDRLEAWLHRRLDTDEELGRWFRLKGIDVDLLAEDLRTATFVVRPGAADFEFAHTSLLEYFLALHLADALLGEDPAKAWALPTPSAETLDFLGEIIAGSATEARLEGLRRLRTPYSERSSELAFRYCVQALERRGPGLPLAGFALDGAGLRGLAITGPANGPLLRMADCSLAGADLRDARLTRVRLERVDLRGARLSGAELHDGAVERVGLADADLTGTIVRGCRLGWLDLRDAHAYRTQWLGCAEEAVAWPADDDAHLFGGVSLHVEPVARPLRAGAGARTFTGHSGGVNGVAWSPDATRLASASDDGGVRVWDPASGEQLQHLTGHTDWVNGVAWSPDATRLASAGHDGVRVWDPASGEQLQHLTGHSGGATGVAWSPDATRLASASRNGGVRVWDPASGEQLQHLTGHTDWVNGVAWSPDATRLASASDDGGVRVWDPASGEQLQHLTGHTDWVNGVAWSPDASRLASAGHDGVRVWDPASGEQLQHLTGHSSGATGVAWSPDATRLASASRNGGVRVWDPASGEQLQHLTGHTDWVNGVAWSPDATRLASAGRDGGVRVWDPASGEQLQHLTGHTDWVNGVAWSPDATRLASASDDGGVRVWDPASGEQLQHLTGHTDWVNGVAWSPDASRLASASRNGGVRVWDPASGEQLQHLTGHTDWVNGVAWSPDATRLASASRDGGVRVWDPASGEQSAAPHRPHRLGERRRVVTRRHPPRQRQRRRRRARLGPRQRRAAAAPHRPHRLGERRRVVTRRQPPRQRRPRRRARLGPRQRRAAAAPHRPQQRGDRRRVVTRRHPPRQRQPQRRRARLGPRQRRAAAAPHRPHRLGDRRRVGTRRHPPRQRRPRRRRARLGPRQRRATPRDHDLRRR